MKGVVAVVGLAIFVALFFGVLSRAVFVFFIFFEFRQVFLPYFASLLGVEIFSGGHGRRTITR